MSIGSWLAERVRGGAASAPATIPSPSFAYVAGWVLVMLLAIEAITGTALP